MIISFSAQPAGGNGRLAISYLVEKRERAIAPVILKGDPAQIKELIETIPFKHKNSFGVLAFKAWA